MYTLIQNANIVNEGKIIKGNVLIKDKLSHTNYNIHTVVVESVEWDSENRKDKDKEIYSSQFFLYIDSK